MRQRRHRNHNHIRSRYIHADGHFGDSDSNIADRHQRRHDIADTQENVDVMALIFTSRLRTGQFSSPNAEVMASP